MMIIFISMIFAASIFFLIHWFLLGGHDHFVRRILKEKKEYVVHDLKLYSVTLGCGLAIFGFIFGSLKLAVGFACVGAAYPYVSAKAKREAFQADINFNLPYFIDLLTLLVEAGLDFAGAVERILQKKKKTCLNIELQRMVDEIKLGVSRVDALNNLKIRLCNKNISSLVAMLIQAQKLGSPLKEILRSYSEKMRIDRFLMAERAGIKASQMILLPLVFCIMPAVFVIIFGPVIVMWKLGVLL